MQFFNILEQPTSLPPLPTKSVVLFRKSPFKNAFKNRIEEWRGVSEKLIWGFEKIGQFFSLFSLPISCLLGDSNLLERGHVSYLPVLRNSIFWKVDAERWIVNLIRTYRIEGAKIDSQSGQVVMGAKPISIHEQVMENTKRMSMNGWFVCQFPFFLLGLFVRSRWPCSLKNWNRTAERSASTQENLIFWAVFKGGGGTWKRGEREMLWSYLVVDPIHP